MSRALRSLAAAALPLLVSGCMMQQTEGGLNSSNAEATASRIAIDAALAQIQSAAQLQVQLDGSTAGFAQAFAASEPSVTAQLVSLTDSEAVMRWTETTCVRAPLPAGELSTVSC